jgi:transposase-like protein
MAANQRNLAREAHWRDILKRHAASKLSIRAFCKQEGIREPNFYAWRRTIRERDSQTVRGDVEANVPPFVPLNVTQNLAFSEPSTISIELEQCIVRLDASTSAVRIAELVRALESAR